MNKNLWLVMSGKSKLAIRGIVESDSKLGFWTLSSMYGIAYGFFIANFYSWGFFHSILYILIPLLFLCPFLGALQISLDSWLLQRTGNLFGGDAPYEHLRAAIAWSKVPYLITLTLWLVLAKMTPETVFLHVAASSSAVLIVLISAAVNIWSFFLLVQSVQEIQQFQFFQAFCNTLLVSLLSFSIISALMFSFRLVYTYLF